MRVLVDMTTIALLLLTTLTNPLTPPPVFRGCDPPPDLCETMHDDCLAVGIDAERCEVLAAGICPGSACMAVTAAHRTCFAEGLDCSPMLDRMAKGLTGCSCTLHCEDTNDISLEQLFAVCFTYPSAIGDDCEEPSAGQCMSILQLPPTFCDVTTCEYVACQRDIMAQQELNQVCEAPPPSCDELVACDLAENGGGAVAPGLPGPDDWKPAPPRAQDCLRISEVFTRPTGQIANRQWVKIRNVCAPEVDTVSAVLKWTRPGEGWGGDKHLGMALGGIGLVGPGQCVVVGGPNSVAANYLPDLDLPIAIAPPMGDGALEPAGVGLFVMLEQRHTPYDAVAWGRGVADFNGPDGKPAKPVAAEIPMAHSLRRVGKAWKDSGAPMPNECQAF